MTFATKRIALLIFPTSTKLLNDVKELTIKILKENQVNVYQIIMEKYFFSIFTKRYMKALRLLSSCLGIKKVELAYFVPTETKYILNKILYLGRKITDNQKFYIKVISDNPKFIARDLEFIATGLLIEKLSNKSISSSSDQDSANKIIIIYIGISKSYVSFKSIKGVGGMIFGYLKKKIFVIIYDHYSLYCLETVILKGFIPNILILFWDYIDLKNKLHAIHNVLNNIHNEKVKLQLLHLKFLLSKEKYSKNKFLLDMIVIDICSFFNILINVNFSFNLFIHPMWLIEYSFYSTLQTGKIPWYPCLFEENFTTDFHSNFQSFHSSNYSTKCNYINQQDKFLIKKKSKELKKNIKTYYIEIKTLNVRPNYIDNILNSI